jgi:hypothetical protein
MIKTLFILKKVADSVSCSLTLDLAKFPQNETIKLPFYQKKTGDHNQIYALSVKKISDYDYLTEKIQKLESTLGSLTVAATPTGENIPTGNISDSSKIEDSYIMAIFILILFLWILYLHYQLYRQNKNTTQELEYTANSTNCEIVQLKKDAEQYKNELENTLSQMEQQLNDFNIQCDNLLQRHLTNVTMPPKEEKTQPVLLSHSYTADILTSQTPLGFLTSELDPAYSDGIYLITLLSETTATLKINPDSVAQRNIMSSVSILNTPACEPFLTTPAPKEIHTTREGKLLLENGVWVVKQKMAIELN